MSIPIIPITTVGIPTPASGNSGAGVGVAVATVQVQSVSFEQLGLRQAPPEQNNPVVQSESTEQELLQDAGGVGVGVAVATAQVQSVSFVQLGLRQALPEQTRPASQSVSTEHVLLQDAGVGEGEDVASVTFRASHAVVDGEVISCALGILVGADGATGSDLC